MKILYAIQGTGNGHLSRARDIVPLLQLKHDVDILVSGTQADVALPFEIKYRFNGLSFVFGKKGGIDLFETYKRSHLKVLFTEINSLPVQEYDLVINDFEPVSAWACYQKNKVCISLSHQAAVLNKKSPRPKNYDFVGKAILKNYAPVDEQYGFHFKAYDKNIFTPVIRKEIRERVPVDQGYYTVYLPAYDDKRIIKVLSACKKVHWQVFSKHNKKPFKEKNISIRPISNEAFINSMVNSTGVLCGAGFETPAEAMFLKKKLMVIPMKGQFEQQCNAAALSELGVPVIKSLQKKWVDKINTWLATENVIEVSYPDSTAAILDMITTKHADRANDVLQAGKKVYSLKKFRALSLKKLVASL